jgi:prepilin-type processing-associated H-X9-DG protein
MVVGPGTISDGTKATKISEITDGTSNTILVVERASSGINWLDPRDLEADGMSYVINDPIDPAMASNHDDGTNVLFCDGSVATLPGSVDAADMKAMCTIAGGEDVGDYWQFGGEAEW